MLRTLCLCAALLAGACSSRTAYQRYPNAPAAFDRAASDPKAVEIADKVLAAAGGAANWAKAKQIRWNEVISNDGTVYLDGEEAWDRWNARHWGRAKTPDGDVNVAYELYGEFEMGFVRNGPSQHKLDEGSRDRALKVARGSFNTDTAMLTMPFLMQEPGATLKYVGQVKDETGADHYDELVVTFADPLRAGNEFHVIVDRVTNLPHRIEITKAGQTVAHTLDQWVEVAGLKFATARKNLGAGNQTITISNVRVSAPEDELFMQPM